MDFSSGPQNLNPTIYERREERRAEASDLNNDVTDEIDRREIFDLIRTINDPEHPLTLEGETKSSRSSSNRIDVKICCRVERRRSRRGENR